MFATTSTGPSDQGLHAPPQVPETLQRPVAALFRRGILALAGLLLLAACAARGPDYEPPQIAVPVAWAQAAAIGSAAGGRDAAADSRSRNPEGSVQPGADAGLAAWWRHFGDPLLDGLVDHALRHSPDLRSAFARLEQARAQRGLAAAGLAPAVSAGASARESAARGSDFTSSFGVGLDAGWEIDLFGRLRRALEAADADLQASAASLATVQASLAAEVALAYVEVRALQARLDVAQRNLASQEETLQLTRWRAQAGLVGSLDVEQAAAGVGQTRAQVPALRASLGQARHRLAVLTGQVPSALDARLEAFAPMPAAPFAVALAIPAEVLGQRPDVRAAERALAAETARVGQAEAARYPGLSLSASIGLEALSLGGLGAAGSTVRSLAASLAGSVFDAGRLRRQVELRSAVQAQALAAYEATVLSALEEVENALLAVARDRDRRAALEAAAQAARNAALLARQRYAAGLVDFQSVLDSARTVLSIEDGLVASQAEGAASIVRLYKALGGGWSTGQ